MAAATVQPARRIRGRVRPPGDKSISHRYALLAAEADGRSVIRGYAPGADCAATLACLERLGVGIGRRPAADGRLEVTVSGRGLGGLTPPAAPLDAQNSGTTMRLLAGILAGHPELEARLVGDGSLSRRPMTRVIDPLTRMGAHIDSTDGGPPLVVRGARLRGVEFSPTVPSAQVKSAVLLAGLHAEGTTCVHEPAGTRDHTEIALGLFGVRVEGGDRRIAVQGGQRLQARDLDVPGDASSAACWAVAAAALPGSEALIEDVGLNPTRTAFFDTLRSWGARIDVERSAAPAGEPRGTVQVRHGGAGRLEIGAAGVPLLIDELPLLAALAALGGELAVSGAGELRVKESDRITALVAGLLALGADAEERPDGFVVRGSGRLSGGVADAAGDHRLAMAFAVAALGAKEPSTILGADAVGVSYPGFFETLASLSE